MAHRWSVTLDAAEPRRLGAFWALALGYREEDPPPGFDTWEAALEAGGVPREVWDDFYAIVDPDGAGPRLFLQRVPEPKTAKNRVHLDVHAPDDAPPPEGDGRPSRRLPVERHVARLVQAGATVVQEHDHPFMGYWVVLRDPEGNELCVT